MHKKKEKKGQTSTFGTPSNLNIMYLQDWRAAMKRNPEDIEALCNVTFLSPDANERKECFRKVVALDPKDVKPWSKLSNTLLDNADREVCYRKIIAMDPTNPSGWYGLGCMS
nr:hypothetical protein [Candidatus Sigynarchaeota archaeon]